MRGASFGTGWFQGQPYGTTSPIPALSASGDWDGNPGTGYSAEPTDPTRTTAKPAGKLAIPDHQYFQDTITIDVIAMASNGGTLINNYGMAYVDMHFEGNTLRVSSPTIRTGTRFDGSNYYYPVFSVPLERTSAVSGQGRFYAELVPSDPSMQSRVIGPFLFSPHDLFATGTIHDYEIDVDPGQSEVAGQRYQTLVAAYSYLQIEQANNPRITIKAAHPSGYYDITRGHFSQWGGDGYCTVEADVPVVIGKASFVDLATAEARPFYTSLRFKGANITLDFENMDALYGDKVNTQRNFWFDGCRIINSGGRENYWQKGPRSQGFSRDNFAWVTDCEISDLPTMFNQASLVRGNIVSGGYFDCANHAECMIANLIDDWDSQFWTNDRNAMTVQYTGAGTGTLEMTGGNDATSRTLTAKVDGATIDTFTVTRGDAAVAADTNWKVSDVVGWLNGLTDWTATTLDDSLRAVMLGSPGNDGAFLVTDVTTQQTFVTQNGKHADFWQLLEGFGSVENFIIAGNVLTRFAGQKVFLSAGSTTLRDTFFVNNAFGDLKPGGQYETASSLFSQLARSVHSHVVIAHNSFEQGILLRPDNGYNPDAYCIVSNNVAGDIDWIGTPDADLVINSNHLFGTADVPSGATNTTTGGDASTLFADLANDDFSPAGDLLSNTKTSIVEFDLDGQRRAATAPVGALT